MNNKQKKVESLVNELLKEFQGEPYWKFEHLINFLKKVSMENSIINTDLGNIWESYSSEDSIFFSNSDKES